MTLNFTRPFSKLLIVALMPVPLSFAQDPAIVDQGCSEYASFLDQIAAAKTAQSAIFSDAISSFDGWAKKNADDLAFKGLMASGGLLEVSLGASAGEDLMETMASRQIASLYRDQLLKNAKVLGLWNEKMEGINWTRFATEYRAYRAEMKSVGPKLPKNPKSMTYDLNDFDKFMESLAMKEQGKISFFYEFTAKQKAELYIRLAKGERVLTAANVHFLDRNVLQKMLTDGYYESTGRKILLTGAEKATAKRILAITAIEKGLRGVSTVTLGGAVLGITGSMALIAVPMVLSASRLPPETLACNALTENPRILLNPAAYQEDGGGMFQFCRLYKSKPECIQKAEKKILDGIAATTQAKIAANITLPLIRAGGSQLLRKLPFQMRGGISEYTAKTYDNRAVSESTGVKPIAPELKTVPSQ